MQIPSPSPPIIIDQYWSLIQCSFYHIYLCPLILCLIYSSPAQCFVAPPQKEDCSTVRCRPGSLSILYPSTSTLYSLWDGIQIAIHNHLNVAQKSVLVPLRQMAL